MSEIENMVKRHKKYPTGHMVDAISYINYFMDQDYINKINKVNDKVELDMNKISLKIEDEQFSYSNVPRPSQVYFIFPIPKKGSFIRRKPAMEKRYAVWPPSSMIFHKCWTAA